jgi:hypothetical protein
MREDRACTDCRWVIISKPTYDYPDECSHPLIAKTGSTKYTRNCEFQRSLGFFKTLFTDECGKKGRYWMLKWPSPPER